MSRLNILHWSIAGKLLFAFGLGGAVIGLLFMAASVIGAARINQDNLQLYVTETTNRKQERVRVAFEALLVEIERVLFSEEANRIFFDAFVHRNDISAANYLRDTFLPTRPDVLVGAWLLNLRDGRVVAQAVGEGKSLPFDNPDQRESEAYKTARTLNLTLNPRGLVIINRLRADGHQVPLLELIEIVVDRNGRAAGYVVVAIDAEALFYSLLRDDNRIGVYSFLVVPDGSTYLAHPETRSQHTISLDSFGVQRALARSVSTPRTYTVGTGSNRREVIGYYQNVELLGQRFILVTELEQRQIMGQILRYGQEIAFPLLLGSGLLIGLLTLLMNALLTPPIQDVTGALRTMLRGGMDAPVRGSKRHDEVGELVNAFIETRHQIRQFTTTMEQRLKERDRDMRVTQDISRAITEERNLQMLMDKVVNLIVENFPAIYHAQIFLVDTQGFAVLRASTGEPGKALLASGHRLEVGSVSVIGQVVEQGQVIIARDAALSDVHRRNEFLPDTRAELAIPLRAGEIVIGALDVQSKQRDSFDPDLVNVLQTLAGQVSIALENVRLYEESQRQLAAIDQQRRTAARQDWRTYFNANRQTELVVNAGNKTEYDFTPLRQQALAEGKTAVGEITPHRTVPFVVPVQLRGETLGVLDCEVPERDFRYDRVLLAEELINRLAVSLDNARLFQESQQAAERERMVNQISAKITGETNIEAILHTTLREVGMALRTPQVAVRLHLPALEPRHLPQTNGAEPETDVPDETPSETEIVVE